MLNITLPDGSIRTYDKALTAFDVCADIGAGLAKSMLAAEVDGKLVDCDTLIDCDVSFKVITSKDSAGLDIIRHSTAHLLAHAVKALFPSAQVTIGPVIEDGFYYDFFYPAGFSEADLEKIEQKMHDLAARDMVISHKTIAMDDAIAFFDDQGEVYKSEIIRDIGSEALLTLYQQEDFTDLCRGPHVPSTAHLRAFKLTKLAGAYWRGDSNNPMLQRIYGTAWANKQQLKDYLHLKEEEKKRDHRKLGQKLDLFHIEESSPGMIFWHPNGWDIYQRIVAYIRGVNKRYGYQEISTPQILDKSLWQKSGHWDKYQDNMFTTHYEDKSFAVKPMSCPGHIQVFNKGLKSYKDLPIKYVEFGCCHRKEPSGALHGIMRVRNFVQDDGHVFCTEAQVQEEVQSFIEEVREVYAHFGFAKISVQLSTRPEKRVGSDDIWDKSEQALEASLVASGLPWTLQPGEGAFYGPKLEFSLKDCVGRVWQCGTIQLDFSIPDRLGASYIDRNNQKKVPVMLHRAILGSFERFIGILLEEYAGLLPLWLCPTQIVVLNIAEGQISYVNQVVAELESQGFRVKADTRNENIGYKIREHSIQRIPYTLICGDKEVDKQSVSVRDQSGKNLGMMSLTDFIGLIGEKTVAAQ